MIVWKRLEAGGEVWAEAGETPEVECTPLAEHSF
jgi:hypothetical protein